MKTDSATAHAKTIRPQRQRMFVVLDPKYPTFNHPLGLFDNHDVDGERLYGCGRGTIFFSKKAAKKAAAVWPGALVVSIRISEAAQ